MVSGIIWHTFKVNYREEKSVGRQNGRRVKSTSFIYYYLN